tara:strand:- start:713 stop:979 length:267 start_codon:yes stop_codon:yes gene_type:complete
MTDKEIKTELTRVEVEKLLEIFNSINSMVDDTVEMMDVRLSQLSDLQDKAYTLAHMFNFRPPMDEDGNPVSYKPKVLPDDDNAWFYEE